MQALGFIYKFFAKTRSSIEHFVGRAMGLQSKKWWKSTSILINNVYNISDNAQLILLQNPPFHTPLPPSLPLSLPPYTGSQCDQYICIFAVEGVNADCRMPTGHSYFYLVTVFTTGQYN